MQSVQSSYLAGLICVAGLYNECMAVMEEGIVVSDTGTVGRIHEFGGMVQMLNADYAAAFTSFQVLDLTF